MHVAVGKISLWNLHQKLALVKSKFGRFFSSSLLYICHYVPFKITCSSSAETATERRGTGVASGSIGTRVASEYGQNCRDTIKTYQRQTFTQHCLMKENSLKCKTNRQEKKHPNIWNTVKRFKRQTSTPKYGYDACVPIRLVAFA